MHKFVSGLASSSYDFIIASPETVMNRAFRKALAEKLGRLLGYVVLDEVHCVSDW